MTKFRILTLDLASNIILSLWEKDETSKIIASSVRVNSALLPFTKVLTVVEQREKLKRDANII